MFSVRFLFNSVLLGAGLAMDAFSVSMADGLHDPGMKGRTANLIAGTFAGFQFVMPLLGWFCVRKTAQYFTIFQKWIPVIALLLLLYIGGKMLLEGIRDAGARRHREACSAVTAEGMTEIPGEKPEPPHARISPRQLILEGIATSIDALSVGFTIAPYTLIPAVTCSLIIAVVTFLLCRAGIFLGKRFGLCLAAYSSVLGGGILILIGAEIFLTGI